MRWRQVSSMRYDTMTYRRPIWPRRTWATMAVARCEIVRV